MKIDEETGLPEVPKGYFWRITVEYGHPRIQLRKKYWLGSSLKGERYIFKPFLPETSDEHIERKAGDVYREYFKPKPKYHNPDGAFYVDYYGDYPPKSLNG